MKILKETENYWKKDKFNYDLFTQRSYSSFIAIEFSLKKEKSFVKLMHCENFIEPVWKKQRSLEFRKANLFKDACLERKRAPIWPVF